MGLLRIYSVLMGGVLFVGGLLSACGGVEPSLAEPSEESFAADSRGARVDKSHPFGQGTSDRVEVDGVLVDGEWADAGDGDGADESGDTMDDESDGCLQMCVMLELCHGLPAGVADVEDCRMGCAQSMYDGVLMERDIRCVEAASDCRDLAGCMEGFWGCDEPCNAFMQCELEDEPDACRQWCGVGIGSGAVRIEQFHCMERISAMQLCGELVDACELSWML